MFKKGLAAAACLAVSAVWAYAATPAVWTLQTKLANAGGTMNVRTAAVDQTTVGTVVYNNYTTTSATIPVKVTALPGYSITSIKKTGTEQLSAPAATYTVNITKVAGTQSVLATFTPATYTVTGAVVGAGTITSSATVAYNGTVGLTASPANGTSILTGVTGATTVKALNGDDVVFPYAGAVKITVANVKAATTVTATYATVAVSAGADKVAALGNAVSLRGSITGGGAPSWTQVSGPAATLAGAATKTLTVTPSAVGTYVFQLMEALRGNTSTVMLTVVNSSADYFRNSCSGCHAPTGVLPSTAFANWSASTTHKPGGINCVSCHTDGPMPTPVNTGLTEQAKAAFCSGCHHTGSVQVANWTKSSHNIDNNGFEEVGCVQCHNPHSTVASATDGKTDSCGACHLDRRGQFPGAKNYSIYTSASMLVMKAPHGQGAPTYNAGAANTNGAQDNAAKGWAPAQTMYLGQGAVCLDCHGHNNTINAGFAEGGHGKVSNDTMNAWVHYSWAPPTRTNDGSRQNGNCDRCHTAYGFLKFANQTTGYTRMQLKSGVKGDLSTANNVLVCVACHSSVEGPLRLDAAPKGSAAGALSNGYFALFSSSAAQLGAGNTKFQVSFPGYKNSSICVPCHSGRTTDAYVRQNIATIGNYSTLQLANYQHAANMGQTFVGKGAWEFTPGKYAAFASNPTPHTTVGMDTAQGPCVGCHYSTVTKTLADGSVINATHSLEINYTSTTCTPCHGAAGPQTAKFEEFSSARFALDQLVRTKFAPLLASGSSDLNVERGGYFRYGRFGKAAGVAADRATAQNAYGAVYNWQLVETWDRAAWAHNPAYARQIVFDTLAYLQTDGADLTGSPANVTAALATVNTINANVDTAAAKNFIDGNKDPNALCVGCHAVARDAGAGYVQDNNGVRAITSEFSKWSHHVTGTTLQDAHCAACHLEGKPVNGKIVVDPTKHMAGNAIHLRNVDTDADIVWSPEAPSFTQMDNFCLSCHDANGATSAASQAIQAIIVPVSGKVASATNPFGDTISNQYDKMERPAVVDAAGQFATGNNSHHAVLGKKYTGRTRAAGARQIADTAAFTSNSGAALPGVRSTIYDAGKFQADYVTLADANNVDAVTAQRTGNGGSTLGDDSTLHCADCHTVGQFAARGTVAFQNMSANFWAKSGQTAGITRYNKGAIGAHGSDNEYLLRNNIGTDARHQGVETATAIAGAPLGYGSKPYLVCYNCHAFQTYGAPGATGLAGNNHVGEYAESDRCNGSYNTIFGNMTGEARLRSTITVQNLPVATDGSTYKYGTQYINKGTPEPFGNAFGIQCANCHNSGVTSGNIFGGIHGSKDQTYTDGMGNTVKHQRFLPGLGNVMYVPGTKGGFTGGSLATFNAYSSNRNGTFTLLPVRGIVKGTNVSTSTTVDNKTVSPAVNAYGYTNADSIKTGSYQYTTGGTSLDLNWEQKSVQPIAGQYDFGAQAMGCYTLGAAGQPAGSRNSPADSNGGVAELTRMAAADSIQAAANGPNGTKAMFDNWGGCDDHAAPQAGADHRQFRKVLRKVTY